MATAGYEADKDRLFIKKLLQEKPHILPKSLTSRCPTFDGSNDGKSIYFISGIKGTVQLFSIDIANKQVSQITKGVHDYNFYGIGW